MTSIQPADATSESGWSGAVSVADQVSAAHAQWRRHGWGDAADGMATVLDLIRVHRVLSDHIDQTLRPLDLTFARYEILMLLSFTRRGAMSIGSIGRLLQVHATSVTSAVDRLEIDGLARRIRSDGDRRKVMVHITQQGCATSSTATEALNAYVFTKLGLATSQTTMLWSLLRAFRANAGDFHVVAARARRTG